MFHSLFSASFIVAVAVAIVGIIIIIIIAIVLTAVIVYFYQQKKSLFVCDLFCSKNNSGVFIAETEEAARQTSDDLNQVF